MSSPSPSFPEDPSKPSEARHDKDAASGKRMEMDLWDLDDPSPSEAASGGSPDAAKGGEYRGTLEPIETKPRVIGKHAETKSAGQQDAHDLGNPEVLPVEETPRPTPKAPPPAKSSEDFEDFDDLGSLDDDGGPPSRTDSVLAATPSAGENSTSPPAASPPDDSRSHAEPGDSEIPVSQAPPPGTETGLSVLLRPLRVLSPLEKVGLGALFVLLAVGILLTLGHWLTSLPRESPKARAADFPITGEKVNAISASTYWREPIIEGPDADRFRRGTQLLPVAELTLTGGPAAIRIFFRDGDNELVGDAITRTIDGETSLKIAATAGFDDLGMHAAYRTGETKLWVVQVFEGPSANASSTEFEPLFETTIKSERR